MLVGFGQVCHHNSFFVRCSVGFIYSDRLSASPLVHAAIYANSALKGLNGVQVLRKSSTPKIGRRLLCLGLLIPIQDRNSRLR